MVTSDHTTTSITNMLRDMREKYEHKYKEDLRFNTIVSDYSWATMHAILEVFNRETVEEYSKRVFVIAQTKDKALVTECLRRKTSITSCVSHTMSRFSRAVKKIANKEQHEFAMYGFSLLLNCLDLESIGNVFRILAFVFLSKKKHPLFVEHCRELNKLVEARPLYVHTKVQQIIIDQNKDATTNLPNGDASEEADDENEEDYNQDEIEEDDDAEHINFDKHTTIKAASPFTQYFTEIFDQTKAILTSSSDCRSRDGTNSYCNEKIINLLCNRFMPYCFIWASFTLNGETIMHTRWNNGAIERFIGIKKGKENRNENGNKVLSIYCNSEIKLP